jgi:hypothetical protein
MPQEVELRKAELALAMPKLSGDTVEEYLDWITKNGHALTPERLQTCVQMAEFTVRLQMGKAQAKATQHTLVQDGVIEAPPPAPLGGQ